MTNNLNTAEWVIVGILSFTLFVFLIVATILCIKLIGLTKEAKKVIETGQSVADKAEDIAENIRDATSIGGLARSYVQEYISEKLFKRKKSRRRRDD